MDKACDKPDCNHTGPVPTCPLHHLANGCQGKVVNIGGDTELRRRLLEMGFCNGTPVQLVRRAPLGDPIEFRLRGYSLSLRQDQARHVQISAS